jgi:hypothetical protein
MKFVVIIFVLLRVSRAFDDLFTLRVKSSIEKLLINEKQLSTNCQKDLVIFKNILDVPNSATTVDSESIFSDFFNFSNSCDFIENDGLLKGLFTNYVTREEGHPSVTNHTLSSEKP